VAQVQEPGVCEDLTDLLQPLGSTARRRSARNRSSPRGKFQPGAKFSARRWHVRAQLQAGVVKGISVGRVGAASDPLSQHGGDRLVVERPAALVEITAGFKLGRYGAQGQLSAFGLFAPERPGERDDVGARLGVTLAALDLLAGDDALASARGGVP
jgi:hypothetical protein